LRAAVLVHRGQIGVATLQQWCPHGSRRGLQTWLRAYRRAIRHRLRQVRWTHAGRVWAMDVSEPLHPIDGVYRYIVHVRDLASGVYLAAVPVRRATTPVVCDLVRALCARYDPPLVLKVDNGSPFRSHQLAGWAAAVRTHLLHSPPRWPRYNGSIEASIGALAVRLHHAAAADGHPESWTADDLETARLAANADARRRDCLAATRVSAIERQGFGRHYARCLDAVVGGGRGGDSSAQRRTALVHALSDLGYMSIERRAT